MRDVYFELLKKDYALWCKNEQQKVENHNMKTTAGNALHNEIMILLEDEKVSRFAKLINYEPPKLMDYQTLDLSILNYLKNARIREWYWDYSNKFLENLHNDKYPLLCYLKDDVYCNIELWDYRFYLADEWHSRKKRAEFERNNDIISAPNEESFLDRETFNIVQAVYLQEAMNSSQETAKKLILAKYGPRK